MDTRFPPYDNDHAQQAQYNRGVVINYHLLIALPLLALAAGCASNEPLKIRAGGAYVEEIKGPVPRDQLPFDPNCFVR